MQDESDGPGSKPLENQHPARRLCLPIYNNIALDKIGNMDEAMLKQAFAQIESLQKKIVYDFLGGAEWPGT